MSICIVGNVVEYLKGTRMGGAERQMSLLAQYLALRGHQVTCVVPGYAGPEEWVKGVHIRSGWLPDKGIGISPVRFVTYRLPTLCRTLLEVAADVYYTRGFWLGTPTVVHATRRNNTVSLVALAHDTDLQADRSRIAAPQGNVHGWLVNSPLAFWYFRRYALERATWVIAQTAEQAARCKTFGLRCQLIPSIVEPPPEGLLNQEEEIDVVWVGRISKYKGVDSLLKLASTMTDVQFHIIGPLQDHALSPLLGQLREKPNVLWTGALAYEEVLEKISKTRVLINTSPAEGFPNAILETWSLGKPVVTLTVNPNGLLSGEERPGECAGGDLQVMGSAIRHYLANPSERRLVGERARCHVQSVHSPEQVCRSYETLVRLSASIA